METREILLEKLKQYLHREPKKAKRRILKDILYFTNRGGKIQLAEGKSGVVSNYSCENSVGAVLGLQPRIIHVSTTYDFREKEFVSLFGTEAGKSGGWFRKVKSGDETLFRINPGPLLPTEVVEKLWAMVKSAVYVGDDDLLPPHPEWVYETNLGVNFLVRKLCTPKFADVFGNRKDIFYRAGKDLWKEPLAMRRDVRVLVVRAVPGHDDGVMWVHSDKPFMGLVRGITKYNGEYLLLKGRVISSTLPPGSKEWPQGEYDIVTSAHNIKWGEVTPGTILRMDVQIVSYEDHKAPEDISNSIEKRKLSILSLLIANIREDMSGRVSAAFRRNAAKIAKKIEKFSTLDMDKLERLFVGDEKSLIAADEALKVRLGFIKDEFRLSEIKAKLVQNVQSARIPGKWLAAIARNFVKPGEVWVSPEDTPEFAKDEMVTVIRYPITSYQSFITLKVVIRDDLPKGLATINGQDAKYLALDGDDHILITYPFSKFMGNGEAVLSERANAEKLDVNKLSPVALYVSGAKAQSLIGYCFNAMAKCLGKAGCAKSEKDKAYYLDLAGRLGMFLDMLAQAIKKPYRLDTEAVDIASRILLSVDEAPIACMCLGKDIQEAVKAVWGISIPDIRTEKVYEPDSLIRDSGLEKMVDTYAKRVESVNIHRKYTFYCELARKLKDWVRNSQDVEYAAKAYYSIAVRMQNDELFTGLMDSTVLLIGRKLYQAQ